MRSKIKTMLLALGVLSSVALPVAAGPHGPGTDRGRGPGDPLMRVIQRLELDDAQLHAVRGLLDARRADAEQAREAIHAAHEAMHAVVRASTVDEQAIRTASAEIAALQAERAIDRARTVAAVRELLSPAQRESLTALLAEREGRREQRGRRGRRSF